VSGLEARACEQSVGMGLNELKRLELTCETAVKSVGYIKVALKTTRRSWTCARSVDTKPIPNSHRDKEVTTPVRMIPCF
jgi:hypothetical protein